MAGAGEHVGRRRRGRGPPLARVDRSEGRSLVQNITNTFTMEATFCGSTLGEKAGHQFSPGKGLSPVPSCALQYLACWRAHVAGGRNGGGGVFR